MSTEEESIIECESARAGHASRRRDRQAAKSIAAGLAGQVLSYGARLAVVPLSLTLVGVEGYGLWLVVGSLVAWSGLTDFGFSPGLINVIAQAYGRSDREGIRRHISTGFAINGILALVLALVFVMVADWSGLPRLLGIKDPKLIAEVHYVVLASGLLTAGMTLTRVIPTVCTALQEGYLVTWSTLGGSLVALLLLLLLALKGTSLLGYTLAMGLPPLTAQLVLGGHLFFRSHPDLRPKLRNCERSSFIAILRFAGPLTLYQIAIMGTLQSANIMIANRLGPAIVPQYSVPYAAFAVLISITWGIAFPFLPAYSEAAARDDWHWIRRRATMVWASTAAIVGGGGILFVLTGSRLVDIWTGGRIVPTTGLLAALGCYCVLRSLSNATGVLLSGLGRVGLLGVVACMSTMLYVAGAWKLLAIVGLFGIPLAGVVAHLLEGALVLPYALRQLGCFGELVWRKRAAQQ